MENRYDLDLRPKSGPDTKLSLVCLACSVAGLVGLFFFTAHVTGMVVNIGEIGYHQEGMSMKVCGELVKHYVSRSGHMFMELQDSTGTINIVVFRDEVHNIVGMSPLELTVGDSACMRGDVEVYKGQLEILPKEIGPH